MDSTDKREKKTRGKTIYYSDQFIVGEVSDPGIFAAAISKNNGSFMQHRDLDVNIGHVGEGLRFSFDLDDEDERAQAIRLVSRLTEGFQNLLSALKRECQDV